MGSGTDSILRDRRDDAALLNSVSRTALAALPLSLTLGVALPREARAGTVNPVQTFMYSLGTYNPITFGAGTNIDAVSPSYAGVYGGSSTPWYVANYGSMQGWSLGIDLNPSGSTVTNGGTIVGTGPAGTGILLPNGGVVTNLSGGSISGYVGVDVGGGAGTVTNAGSITGRRLRFLSPPVRSTTNWAAPSA